MKTSASIKPKLSINAFGKDRFFLGVSITAFSTIIAYGFLFCLRELFKLFSTTFYFPNRAWEVNPLNMAISDFIIAMLACQIGQMIFFEFCFSRPTLLPYWNFRKRLILVDNRNLLSNFLFFGLKVACAIGFFTFTDMLGLLQMNGIIFWIFILSIIVLHLQAWTTMNRTFQEANKWMLKVFSLMLVCSAMMSQFHPIDYIKLNQIQLNRIPDYHLIIKPPIADVGWMSDYSYLKIPFSLQAKNGKTELASQHEIIDWTAISGTIEQTKKRLPPYLHSRLFASLTIDKEVPMEAVFKLKHQLRSNGIHKIAYTFLPAISINQQVYPFDRSYGLMEKTTLICNQNSLKKSLTILKKTNSLAIFDYDIACHPFSFMWEEIALSLPNKTIIYLAENGQIFRDGELLRTEKLVRELEVLFSQSRDVELLLDINGKANYQDYIQLKVAIWKAKKNLLDKTCQQIYGMLYSEDLPLAYRKNIQYKYSFSIIEPNSEVEFNIYRELERIGKTAQNR